MLKRKNTIYNLTIAILALISIVFAIADIIEGLTQTQQIIDNIIYAIFVFDYFIRFILAGNKKNFIKNNKLDLIAIIPLNSSFRAFRLFKFEQFSRLAEILRLGSFSARSYEKGKRFFNTNGFKHILFLVVLAILSGSAGMVYAEGMSVPDALWWSFVTATTVGYGDIVPATTIGRIIAAILMIFGIGLIGSLTSTITSFFIHNKKSNTIDSDKIDIAMAVYQKLSEEEKEVFLNNVTQDS